MKKASSGAGATLRKTKSSIGGVGAMFMKRKGPESELCHFYDGSIALVPKHSVILHDNKEVHTE